MAQLLYQEQEQPKNFAEELMKEFCIHQLQDETSEYNKIRAQCREAAKEGKIYLELAQYLGSKELFEADGLVVQEWINTNDVLNDPRELTVLVWGNLPRGDGFYYYDGWKFTERTVETIGK